jgi:methionine salvage enolase-phosphatase E1
VCVTQAAEDGGAAIPGADAGKGAVIAAVVAWVVAAIDMERKVGALKQLQGHVWRTGFAQGKLVAQLFRLVDGSSGSQELCMALYSAVIVNS